MIVSATANRDRRTATTAVRQLAEKPFALMASQPNALAGPAERRSTLAPVETLDHRELKTLAMAFLSRLGSVVVASEVSCPIARFRVDVAAWCELGDEPFARRDVRVSRATLFSGSMRSARPPVTGMASARTIVVECKQSRADFLRDDASSEVLLRERERLRRRRSELEETLVKRYEPQLRTKGSSLFTECEEWRFEESRLSAYRQVLVALKKLDQRLHGETKFCLLARYRLADRLYIAAPAGLIRPSELPSGWGLLECRRQALRRGEARVGELDDLPAHETVTAPALGSPDHRRLRFLRNMAVAATRSPRGPMESTAAAMTTDPVDQSARAGA